MAGWRKTSKRDAASTVAATSTASAISLRPVVRHARRLGVDADRLLDEFGIAPADLDTPDARLPVTLCDQVWAEAASRSGDDAFGLRAAEDAPEGMLDVLDYSLTFSSTLGEGLGRVMRYYRLLSDALACEGEAMADGFHIRRLVDAANPHEEDYAFALLLARSREMTGVDIRARRVCVTHPRHGGHAHETCARGPVRYDALRAEVVLDAAALDLPAQMAKPYLAQVLDRHATDLLARLPKNRSYVDLVRRTVTRVIQKGPPTLDAIARDLRTAPRTVQRRLQDAGTSHRDLVDEVRRELAERYLATPHLSITEIAFLLGFLEESGFRRSYKRWTGKSPSKSRPAPLP